MISNFGIMVGQPAQTMRTLGWRRGALGFAAAILTACMFAVIPTTALAAEGKRPMIVSMGSGAGGEITISAEINPEGLETSYELELECGPGEPMACDELPSERIQGHLPAVDERREVSMTVTGLKPGKYWFAVLAVNGAGGEFRNSDILTVPEVPPGACPDGCSTSEPYKPEVSKGELEAAEHQAAIIFAEAEAKRRLAKEQEEQKKAAELAAIYSSEALALKQAQEREAREAATREEAEHPACIVPALKGDTLAAARRALTKAHCRLGPVYQPIHHYGTLYVSAQGTPAGKRLAPRAHVALVLNARRASHRLKRRQ